MLLEKMAFVNLILNMVDKQTKNRYDINVNLHIRKVLGVWWCTNNKCKEL